MATPGTVVRGADLDAPLRALRSELDVPEGFPAEVLAEATAAAGRSAAADRLDARELPLVTLDPPGSRDLDQAFALEQTRGGFVVTYAIADVAAFVAPEGAVDAEARRRGETLYLPDGRVPLHPPVLSEGAASLLPGQDRPAVLWRITLDAAGEPTQTTVRRAVVRSRAQLDYPSVDRAGAVVLPLLRTIGELRRQSAHARGAVSLPVPEQVVSGSGIHWSLSYRIPLPVEDWNAELSLLTGMAAARLMLDGGVGLLRTMPAPEVTTVASLRRRAQALGVPWPDGATASDVLRGLDPAVATHAALLRAASVLFRGAGYSAFDGAPPPLATHAAVAAPYAHATAPLRRLADRFVSEVCLALCAGAAVPGWARTALPALPALMAEADRRAHLVDRAVVDLAETLVLQDRCGDSFDGVVVEAAGSHGEVQLRDPAVRARLDGANLPVGREVTVRLHSADPVRRTTVFTLA